MNSVLLLDINPASGTPLYRQIVDQVRRLVSGGQLQAGDELPSVRELARRHAINPMTVSKAYSLMEAEGVVERQRGKPMRIGTNAVSADSRLEQLDEFIDRLVLAARQLDIDDATLLETLSRKLKGQKQ